MAKKTALRRLCKTLPIAEPLPEEDEDEIEEAKPTLTPVIRDRGAAAALDAFASSSEDIASPQAESAATDETSGGVETSVSAAQTVTESPATADVPAEDPIAAAHVRGQAAKVAGHQRKALPGEYRTPERDAEAQAWIAGFEGKPL